MKDILKWILRLLLYFFVIPVVLGLLAALIIKIFRSLFSKEQLIVGGAVTFGLLIGTVVFLEIRKRINSKRARSIYTIDDNRLMHIDWLGEENEGEIQEFIEHLTGKTIEWTRTNELRSNRSYKEREGKSAIKLLKAIDKDIQFVDSRLLFQKTDGDEYVFTVVDSKTFENVISKKPTDLFDVSRLKG